MNQIELLEKIKNEDGLEAALDKFRHMTFSLSQIRRSLENGNSNPNFSNIDDVCDIQGKIMRWKSGQSS
ncbi:hypothetical protein IR116_08970 [Streptococcus sp. 19428wA2_WM07]|nr:hypothetical protein [Streptococcus sp. 19428wA2_WM07]TFU24715.1 hypothetical protein E4T71_08920 [Streptococcus sp. WM07]